MALLKSKYISLDENSKFLTETHKGIYKKLRVLVVINRFSDFTLYAGMGHPDISDEIKSFALYFKNDEAIERRCHHVGPSTPLKDFVEVGQIGNLKQGPVRQRAGGRHQVLLHGRVDHVLYHENRSYKRQRSL